jgi:translation initiation factor eIF-2B subunit beta
LTYGYSRLVELFLKAAGNKRRFQLIIAEAAPSLEGHRLAQLLSKVPSISITLIPDSNIYAIMARVNKVRIYCMMCYSGEIHPLK